MRSLNQKRIVRVASTLTALLIFIALNRIIEKLNISENDNISFATFGAEQGLDSQLDFLQTNIVTPFLNKAIYESSGELDKVPRGIVLYGSNGDAMELIAKLIKNEISLQGGKDLSYFDSSEVSSVSHVSSYQIGESITKLFRKAAENKPALIFLKDVHILYESPNTDFEYPNSIVYNNLVTEISKVTPGEIVVVASVDKLWRVTSITRLLNKKVFTKFLHIPKILRIHERRNALVSCTSNWEVQPTDEVLDTMANKTSAFLVEEGEIDDKIKSLCTSAYSLCVSRYRQSLRIDYVDKIAARDIKPSLEDWETALRNILSKNGNVLPTLTKRPTTMRMQATVKTAKVQEMSKPGNFTPVQTPPSSTSFGLEMDTNTTKIHSAVGDGVKIVEVKSDFDTSRQTQSILIKLEINYSQP